MFSVLLKVKRKLYMRSALAFQLGGWPTCFENLEEKHNAIIPPLDHAHTYHESTVHPPAHTKSRLFHKVFGLLHTHTSTATHTDTCTRTACVLALGNTSWKGRSWQLLATTGKINEYLYREQDELFHQWQPHSWLPPFLGVPQLLTHDSSSKDEKEH